MSLYLVPRLCVPSSLPSSVALSSSHSSTVSSASVLTSLSSPGYSSYPPKSTIGSWFKSIEASCARLTANQRILVDLCVPSARPSAEAKSPPPSYSPRFTVNVVDADSAYLESAAKHPLTAPFPPVSILLIPQGREGEWLFASVDGQRSILKQTKSYRILVIFLNRGHSFQSMQAVQAELNPLIGVFIPSVFHKFSGRFPYLSLGDPAKGSNELGSRKVVKQIDSQTNGILIVEDIDVNGERQRNLVFCNTGFVQSEGRFLTSKGAAAVSDRLNFAYLPSVYHRGFIAALSLAPRPLSEMTRILNIGLGAGNLPSFLHSLYPQLHIDNVELDEQILSLAKEYFQFQVDEKQTIHLGDGIDYVKRAWNNWRAAKSNTSAVSGSSSSSPAVSSVVYDSILIDCNSQDLSEGISFPPAAFLEPSFLLQCYDLITENGILVLNFGCRSTELKAKVYTKLYEIFSAPVLPKDSESSGDAELRCGLSAAEFDSGDCWHLDLGEDIVNVVLVGRKGKKRADTAASRTDPNDFKARETWETFEGRLINPESTAVPASAKQFQWDEETDFSEQLENLHFIVKPAGSALAQSRRWKSGPASVSGMLDKAKAKKKAKKQKAKQKQKEREKTEKEAAAAAASGGEQKEQSS